MADKEYLGDGVCVRFDGYQIWLETNGYETKNEIAIEPAVYTALKKYAARLGWEDKNED